MIKFSSEQLLVLQKTLSSPLPPLAAPPNMLMMAGGRSSPPPPAPLATQQRGQRGPLPLSHAASLPCDPPAPGGPAHISLSPLAGAYLVVVNVVAISSATSPDLTLEGALAASPLLTLTLGLHALALLDTSPAASCLAVACALCVPSLIRLGPPRLAPWLCCAALSAFFLASTPRGLLRFLSAIGSAAVVALGAFLLATADYGQRAAWGSILVALSIQSVVSTGRLRGQRLTCAAGG